jgi:hypothetical protein
MKYRFYGSLGILMLLSVLVTGCLQPRPPKPTATPVEEQVPTFSPQPLPLSDTPPVVTPPVVTPPVVTTPAPTETPPSPTQTVTGTRECTDDASFVADVTIPDGTVLRPGESFVKTWRLGNTGTCDWGEGYVLTFVDGNLLGAPNANPVPYTQAGGEADISIDMLAPIQPGIYTSAWQMKAPDGTMFGVQIYTQIRVLAEETAVPTATPTRVQPTPTRVPPTETVEPTADTTCINDADFIADVTIPDDMEIEANTTFTKTWELRNSGTCDWSNRYALVLVSGHALATSGAVTVEPTAAGETVRISVFMTAPGEPGTYTSTWQMTTPRGELFGTRPYVRIVVTGAGGGTDTGWDPPDYYIPPYIHGITAEAREIYLEGQRVGNRANIFSKVGDSLTDEHWFLYPVGDGQAILHNYDYLGDVVDFYLVKFARDDRNSFNNRSIAATGGWDSSDLLDPANSAPYSFCGNRSPLECELQTVRPAVAIIAIGSNEAQANVENGLFRANLERIVEMCIDNGVIPVLNLIPWNKYRVNMQPYNAIIEQVAHQYQVPYIDYYTPMETLPNHGLRGDDVHPSYPPDGNTADFSDNNLERYGYNIRNLLTLQMLDAIWQMVMY